MVYAPFTELALGHATAVDCLSSIRQKFTGEAAFFQSKSLQDSGEGRALIGLKPFASLRFRGETDPYAALSEKMRELRGKPVVSIGYFSYESARFMEPTIGSRAAEHDAEIFIFDNWISIEDGRARFYGTDESLLKALQSACLHAVEKMPRTVKEIPEFAPDSFASLFGKERFCQAVEHLKERIFAGDIFQAVISERFTRDYSGDSAKLFRALCEINPSPYQFFIATGEKTLLGASPEMLLTSKHGILETHPIAGTTARAADPAAERELEARLLGNEKEKAEHLMLVDLARNDIGRVAAAGSVKVDSFMQIKKFSGLMHLVSRVTGKLSREFSPLQALQACFPAGTLSGAPKIRAMQLIAEQETVARGSYGGAVICMESADVLDSCIAIRCIELRNGRAIIQAGAGIVADSNPESEYIEVLHKSRAARKALAMAEAGL